MLRATRREFERGYRSHGARCRPCDSPVARLLLFYAVECGLKTLILQMHKADRYIDLAEDLQVGHDIRRGLAAVYAPAHLTVRTTRTRHGRNPQELVSPRELHEAFRYGIQLENEVEVTSDLEAIMDWLRERLG